MSGRRHSPCSSARSPCCRRRARAWRRRRSRRPTIPSVTVRGQTYTPRSVLARNMGTRSRPDDGVHAASVIGNIYYVGTKTLSSFLVVTPEGNILIDTTYERNVPVIEKSVADLGFKFSDVKILLGNHAHRDHQEGDALVKQKTGAQVVAMAEDVPALQAMKPGGKEHPIDRVLHDGDKVTPRRHDARRPSHPRPHPRLHHLDHDGAGGRQDLQRHVRLQPAPAGGDHAGDRRRVRPLLQDRAGAALRRPARRSRRAVRHAGEVREAQGRPAQSLHRSRRAARSRPMSSRRCSTRSSPSSRRRSRSNAANW